MKSFILIFFLLLQVCQIYGREQFVRIEVKKGETIQTLFRKWEIPYTNENLLKFRKLNPQKLKQDKILWGVSYRLPIIEYSQNDFEKYILPKIEYDIYQALLKYNDKILAKGIYDLKDKILIPFHISQTNNLFDLNVTENEIYRERPKLLSGEKRTFDPKAKLINPYFGKKHLKVNYIDKSLKGCAFYLVSGHGGPDPGAIGKYKNFEMAEDEYAYDITLRLAYELVRRRAKVFMITIDTSDGIRDKELLDSKGNELFYGGVPIALNQKERLRTCAEIINKLYKENRNKYKKHISINIHLDSRGETEKIDVFFYYQENNSESIKIANFLLNTLQEQYEKHQPGRGYSGTVSTRNLFMLRNTIPPTVYIELGNIQNPHNQIRFIKSSNREAIAKWIAMGLVRYCRKE
ncbi:MAG: N-acetylmuramoyl-L-alanine amidase family protein [Candidatus Kapaibacteriales bacterium]